MSASLAKAAYWIANRAQAGISTQVSFLNAHCVNVARKDWRYRDSLTQVLKSVQA